MNEKSFNKADYLTVKEFATMVEKSPQSVYKRLERKENKVKYMFTYDGRKYIHKAAVWDLYGIDAGFNTHVNDTETAIQPEDEQDHTYHFIAILKEQIVTKDKQIADLTELLKHEQMLHAATQSKLQETLARLQALTDTATANDNQSDQGGTVSTDNPEEPEAPEDNTVDTVATGQDKLQVDEVQEPQKRSFGRWLRRLLGS